MKHITPPKQGLYDPRHEHDACGVGMIVDLNNRPSNSIVRQALEILVNLTHRGACGAEKNTGDGAGILMQTPDRFFRKVCGKLNITLPDRGSYGVGMIYLPPDEEQRLQCEAIFEEVIRKEGQTVLGWRDVPVDGSMLGKSAADVQPVVRQIFIGAGELPTPEPDDGLAFERKLYVIRRLVENGVKNSDLDQREFFYVPSLSCKTIIYKGMFVPEQVEQFYGDLSDPDVESSLALVHSRFSTNTFPNWARSHPYRYLAHNGEINTLRGNVNWMTARESMLEIF